MLLNKDKYGAEVKRERTFAIFDKKYVKFSHFWMNRPKDLKKASVYYDCFVCGSDQVWNPSTYNYGANNFAMFAGGGKKKITMAPSFGVTDFPAERKEEFATYLNSFSQLSIREKSGADIIRQLTGRDTQVVIDPTLMFKADEWEKIEECPSWLKNKKYLLTYTLGNQYQKEWIQQFAEKYNLDVINLMDQSNLDYYTVDPAGFLYLIHHCEIMVTDSFHGSVFSVLFDRPLVIMERKDEFVSMNTRLDNLV